MGAGGGGKRERDGGSCASGRRRCCNNGAIGSPLPFPRSRASSPSAPLLSPSSAGLKGLFDGEQAAGSGDFSYQRPAEKPKAAAAAPAAAGEALIDTGTRPRKWRRLGPDEAPSRRSSLRAREEGQAHLGRLPPVPPAPPLPPDAPCAASGQAARPFTSSFFFSSVSSFFACSVSPGRRSTSASTSAEDPASPKVLHAVAAHCYKLYVLARIGRAPAPPRVCLPPGPPDSLGLTPIPCVLISSSINQKYDGVGKLGVAVMGSHATHTVGPVLLWIASAAPAALPASACAALTVLAASFSLPTVQHSPLRPQEAARNACHHHHGLCVQRAGEQLCQVRFVGAGAAAHARRRAVALGCSRVGSLPSHSFYDDERQNWSIRFDEESHAVDFAKQVRKHPHQSYLTRAIVQPRIAFVPRRCSHCSAHYISLALPLPLARSAWPSSTAR